MALARTCSVGLGLVTDEHSAERGPRHMLKTAHESIRSALDTLSSGTPDLLWPSVSLTCVPWLLMPAILPRARVRARAGGRATAALPPRRLAALPLLAAPCRSCCCAALRSLVCASAASPAEPSSPRRSRAALSSPSRCAALSLRCLPVAAPLRRCAAAPLRRCAAAPLRRCAAAPLRRCAAPLTARASSWAPRSIGSARSALAGPPRTLPQGQVPGTADSRGGPPPHRARAAVCCPRHSRVQGLESLERTGVSLELHLDLRIVTSITLAECHFY
jgi:hypothetical protein